MLVFLLMSDGLAPCSLQTVCSVLHAVMIQTIDQQVSIVTNAAMKGSQRDTGTFTDGYIVK